MWIITLIIIFIATLFIYVNIFVYKAWYKEGKKYRLKGPTFEGSDGYKIWFKKGNKHRTDGPAVIWGKMGNLYKLFLSNNEREEYYINGIKLSKNQFNNWTLRVRATYIDTYQAWSVNGILTPRYNVK